MGLGMGYSDVGSKMPNEMMSTQKRSVRINRESVPPCVGCACVLQLFCALPVFIREGSLCSHRVVDS